MQLLIIDVHTRLYIINLEISKLSDNYGYCPIISFEL